MCSLTWGEVSYQRVPPWQGNPMLIVCDSPTPSSWYAQIKGLVWLYIETLRPFFFFLHGALLKFYTRPKGDFQAFLFCLYLHEVFQTLDAMYFVGFNQFFPFLL